MQNVDGETTICFENLSMSLLTQSFLNITFTLEEVDIYNRVAEVM